MPLGVSRPFHTPSIASRKTLESDIFNLPSFGRLEGSIPELCAYIDTSPSTKGATITTIICRGELDGVRHKFLLVQARKNGRKDLWIRLDRRVHRTSTLAFALASGIAPANDCVSPVFVRVEIFADLAYRIFQAAISLQENSHLEGRSISRSSVEAHIICPFPPPLKQLSILLKIMVEESVQYKIWPVCSHTGIGRYWQ